MAHYGVVLVGSEVEVPNGMDQLHIGNRLLGRVVEENESKVAISVHVVFGQANAWAVAEDEGKVNWDVSGRSQGVAIINVWNPGQMLSVQWLTQELLNYFRNAEGIAR